jgi:hypothetical protein
MKQIINHTELPKKAWNAISKEQQSYIDEFTFYEDDDNCIEAWYAGELLAYWEGKRWREPLQDLRFDF